MKFYWFYFMVLFFLIGIYFFSGSSSSSEITWDQLKNDFVENQDIKKIVVVNKEIAEIYIKPEKLHEERHKEIAKKSFFDEHNEGPHYSLNIGSVETFERKMDEAQEEFPEEEHAVISYVNRTNWFGEVLKWAIPIFFFVLIWLFILGRMSKSSGGMGSKVFNFGKSKAKLFDKGKETNVTFENVAGLEEAKEEVKELVDFLKSPQQYTRLGAKIPKGVILAGPPGTGKTLLVRALAGEAQVPFFSLSGSEFVEMFVGVGASRVRDLFQKAKQKAPSIIFIDEIDAIGRTRGKAASFQSNDERESTLNQLLMEMDGFGANTGVIVLAATNRADVLDKALLRPGRFDRHINLELPNLAERKAIFTVHMRDLIIDESVDKEILASQSPGFSGADIANICNEAALIAARRKKNAIDKEDFMNAMDRVIGGLEKKSKVISPKEKKLIAFHESGHAVVSWYLEHADALLKVSIVPRGKSLGAAWYLPEEQQINTRSQFLDKICAALGGRAAEEIIFNEISSGALDDLEKITKQAYTMVSIYGLSKIIGPLSFYDSSGNQENSFQKPYSEATARLIDEEAKKIVEESYSRAINLLTENKEKLTQLAQLLLKKEVVHKNDLIRILGERPSENNANQS